MAQRIVENGVNGPTSVDWLSYNHGDDVKLLVTSRHQHRGTPKNRRNCAVVQAILESHTNVYDAVVQEGDVFIFIKDIPNNKYWKLRCLMDAKTRELAKQRYDEEYNQGIVAADTEIALRIDKLREILGPKIPETVLPFPSGTSSIDPPGTPNQTKNHQAKATLKSQTLKAAPHKRSVPNNPLRAPQNRRPKRSRWDVSYYKIEKKRA